MKTLILFSLFLFASAEYTLVQLDYTQLEQIIDAIEGSTPQPVECVNEDQLNEAIADINAHSTNVGIDTNTNTDTVVAASTTTITDNTNAAAVDINANTNTVGASVNANTDTRIGELDALIQQYITTLGNFNNDNFLVIQDQNINIKAVADAVDATTTIINSIVTGNEAKLVQALSDLAAILEILEAAPSNDYLLDKPCEPYYIATDDEGTTGTCSWRVDGFQSGFLFVIEDETPATFRSNNRADVCTQPSGTECALKFQPVVAGTTVGMPRDCWTELFKQITKFTFETGCKPVIRTEPASRRLRISTTDTNIYNKDVTPLHALDRAIEDVGSDWFTSIDWSNNVQYLVSWAQQALNFFQCATGDEHQINVADGVITRDIICGDQTPGFYYDTVATPYGEKEIRYDDVTTTFVGISPSGTLQEETYRILASSPRYDEGLAHPVPNIHRSTQGPGWGTNTAPIFMVHLALNTDDGLLYSITDYINAGSITEVGPLLKRSSFSRNPLIQPGYFNDDYTVHDTIFDPAGNPTITAMDTTFGQLGFDLVCQFSSIDSSAFEPTDFCTFLGQSHLGTSYNPAVSFLDDPFDVYGTFIPSQPPPSLSDTLTNAFTQSQNVQSQLTAKYFKARQWITAAFNLFDFFVDVDLLSMIPDTSRRGRW